MALPISTQISKAYNFDLSTRELIDNGSRMQFHLESIRRACLAITNDDNQEKGVQSTCLSVIEQINSILLYHMDNRAVNFHAPAISGVYQAFSRELWHVKGLENGCFHMWQTMMKGGICPMTSNA